MARELSEKDLDRMELEDARDPEDFKKKYSFYPFTFKYGSVKIKMWKNGYNHCFYRKTGEYAGYISRQGLLVKDDPPDYLFRPWVMAFNHKGQVVGSISSAEE